jgi:hypothetical protein
MKMRKIAVVSILVALFAIAGKTQIIPAWEKDYGGSLQEIGRKVIETSSGQLVAVGLTASQGGGAYDVFLLKTNFNGDSTFGKAFGGPGQDEGYDVKETFDGGYAIVGFTSGFLGGTTHYSYLLKTDSSGITQWAKTFSTESEARSLVQMPDSGFVFVGHVGVNRDLHIVRTNSIGDTIWTKSYSKGAGGFIGVSVIQAQGGGLLVSATNSEQGGGNGESWILKLDYNGDTLWTQSYAIDVFREVKAVSGGGYICGGIDGTSAYLMKVDGSGNPIWGKLFGWVTAIYGYGVALGQNGGYALGGSIGTGQPNGYQAMLLLTDGNGDTVQTQFFGDVDNDQGYGIAHTSDGGWVLVGRKTIPQGTNIQLLLTRFGGNGVGIVNSINSVLTIYPNPSKGSFRIVGGDDDLKWKIIDLNGRSIQKGLGSIIDGNSLTRGVYLLEIEFDSKLCHSRLIVE